MIQEQKFLNFFHHRKNRRLDYAEEMPSDVLRPESSEQDVYTDSSADEDRECGIVDENNCKESSQTSEL